MLLLGIYIIVESLRTPGWAAENDAALGIVVLGLVGVVGTAAMGASSLYLSVFEDHLALRKGTSRSALVMRLSDIERVIVHEGPSPKVVVHVGNRSFAIANSLSEFRSPRLDSERESSGTAIARMQRIATVVELDVERQKRQKRSD
jgi:hypothetical protein